VTWHEGTLSRQRCARFGGRHGPPVVNLRGALAGAYRNRSGRDARLVGSLRLELLNDVNRDPFFACGSQGLSCDPGHPQGKQAMFSFRAAIGGCRAWKMALPEGCQPESVKDAQRVS
jgi:hypothetical protein